MSSFEQSNNPAGTPLPDGREIDPLIGRTLEGKYRLDAKLGAGGMGTVYRTTRLIIGDTVALKILHPQQVADPQAIERFRREAQAAARLKHQNAVDIYDFGVADGGLVYLVMEMAEGQSLREIIKLHGPVTPFTATKIMSQVCAALDEAHRQNIVHRDLKPDNIIVAQTSAGLQAKVLDFGIAKMRDLTVSDLTLTGSVMGTPYYMSPEHCMGEELDCRSDIYSLGIVLFEMLAGVVPFNSPTPTAVVIQHVNQAPPSLRAINASISPEIEAVVMHALEKRREARPWTAGQFAQGLIASVHGKQLTASADLMPASTFYQSSPSTKSSVNAVTDDRLGATMHITTTPVTSGARSAAQMLSAQGRVAPVVLPTKNRLSMVLGVAVIIMIAAIGLAGLMWLRWLKTATPTVRATITDVKVGESFTFPIINLPDKAIADRINTYAINSVLGDQFSAVNLESKFTEQNKQEFHEGLSGTSYKVTLNTPSILSLSISSCFIGAHENCGETQFNFDLTTGYEFTIDQLVMPSKWDEIRKLVCRDSKPRVIQAKNRVRKQSVRQWYEKDFAYNKSYEDYWQEEMKKEYWAIKLEKGFKLSNDGMVLFYSASLGFPMVIRYEEPNTEYFYSWAVLKPFLIQSSPISTLIGTQSVDASKPAVALQAPPGMAYVPGAEFPMGNNAGDESERPQHNVTVNSFFIDINEVTCEEYERFILASERQPPATWNNGKYPSGWERRPVTGVNWDDATAYAEWAGKRLPTEQEWEFAARGADRRRYSWAGEWKDGLANAGPKSAGQVETVGTYPAGMSPFGAVDMVGNAWEWTASDFVAYPGDRFSVQPTRDLKTIRGGCFLSRPDQATTTIRVGWPARGGNEYDNTGFRCAKDALRISR